MKSTKILAMLTVLFMLAVVFTACEFGPKGCEHDWLDATCTEPKTCNICAEIEGEPLGHKEETIAGKAATCTEAGLTDGKKCSACDKVLLAQEAIPAKGHKDEDANYVCDVCEAELCTAHIPADAVKENEVAPTCSAEGSYELVVKCSTCNEELSRETVTVDKLAHIEGEAVRENEVAPTCSAEGSYELVVKCSTCNEELSRETVAVDKLDHTASEAIRENEVAPTCEGKGSYDEVVKCSVCSEEMTRTTVEVDSLGHKDGEATRENEVAPTCTKEGSYDAVVKCTVCEKELSRETKSVEKLPHTEEAVAGKAATCTETGLTDGKKCLVCGETLLAQELIAALGHKDENVDYKCDACGTDLCTDHIPAEAIKENEVVATCTSSGSYDSVVKCSRCGEELERKNVTVDALPHIPGDWIEVTPVTCESAGERIKQCGVCSSTVAQETIEALGHNITSVVEATKKTYSCANGCGKREVKYLVTVNYLFTDGTVAATADVLEYDDGTFYTVEAKKLEGYVASHDYVKGHILSAGGTINIYYSQVDVWDGTSVSASLSGTGTAEDPYLIQSGADLAYVAKVVNDAAAATANFKGMYFKMTKSIDLGGNELKIGGYSSGKVFHGFFDGNNCSIRGIKATQSLFGQLKDGYIKNLSTYGTVTTTEKKGVAGLVSYMTGATVENITNYVDVTGIQQVAGVVGWLESNTTTFAKNCVNYGNVVATSYQIGGIAGFAKGTLTNCVNFGDVTSSGSGYVGGIGGAAKDAKGSRSNCVNYGNISAKSYIGGCFGQINKTTTDCYSYGTVKLVSGSDVNIGEVVGNGASYLKYTAE